MKAIIGLDAGHGGDSSGTYSVNTVYDGLFEKDFALEQALLIKKHLIRNGFGVVMSRETDINPGNVSERAKKMIAQNCDFALSIHFNGFETKSANGTEVFVPYGEKYGIVEAGLYNLLNSFFKIRKPFARSNSHYNRNEIFDKKLNLETKRFEAVSEQKDYFGFIRTCWESGISADLLEICFLTNPDDFKAYIDHKEEIAEGIAISIVEAFGERYLAENEVPKKKPIRKPKTKVDVIN